MKTQIHDERGEHIGQITKDGRGEVYRMHVMRDGELTLTPGQAYSADHARRLVEINARAQEA